MGVSGRKLRRTCDHLQSLWEPESPSLPVCKPSLSLRMFQTSGALHCKPSQPEWSKQGSGFKTFEGLKTHSPKFRRISWGYCCCFVWCLLCSVKLIKIITTPKKKKNTYIANRFVIEYSILNIWYTSLQKCVHLVFPAEFFTTTKLWLKWLKLYDYISIKTTFVL